ncbi:MAG: FAD binding domain-containing protein [Betaproteobacteria bacterium]
MEYLATAGLLPTSARTLAPLRLWQPTSIAAAVDCINRCEAPVLLAGGTDLVAQYNEGLAPRSLIDISRIDAMRQLRQHDGVLHIGALVTHHDGSGDVGLRALVPGFAHAWSRIANPRIRFRATLGGNLMARRTRYEGALLLQALEAKLNFTAPSGTHQVPADSLWQTGVARRGLLTGIEVDTRNLMAFDYERSLRPLMTQALAVWQQPSGLRLGLTIATEHLSPISVSLALPGIAFAQLRARAAAIARDLLTGLPSTFADVQVTTDYARRAGAALMARQLESVHG